EGLAAQLAAQWIDDEQLRQLRRADELFERSVREFVAAKGDRTEFPSEDLQWARANDLFHEVVHEAAANELLKKTISDLHRVFPRRLTWLAIGRDSRLLESNVVQHQQIREAIERRDATTARALMTSHVQRAGELVLTSVEHRGDLARVTDARL